MTLQRLALVFILLISTAGCVAVQQQLPAQPIDQLTVADVLPAGEAELESDFRYRLSYGDEIDVRFLRQLDYSTTVVVGFDGTVKLPFLPSVRVQGLTVDEATEELQQRYASLIESSPPPDKKIYLLGPRDVIEIKFPFVAQYSSTVAVRPDGRISLPLIGAIVAEGKDPGTLQRDLVRAYRRHMDNPVISLNVVQAASSTVYSNGRRVRVALPEMDNLHLTLRSGLEPKIYVGGEVNAPQALQYQPMMTSLQAIMSAGGINRRAALDGVVILRKGVEGEPRYIVRDLLADVSGQQTSYRSGQATTNDILLRPFDVIIVPKTAIASVADTLNSYLYDLLPMLKNSSLGFTYQLGTMEVDQNTFVRDPALQ
jgi:polysaccharide export outer membrane protein